VYARVRVFGRSAGGVAGEINAHRPVAGDRAMRSAWLARELKRAGMSEHQSARRSDRESHEQGTGNTG